MNLPLSSTAMTLSASPSCAIPSAAPVSLTFSQSCTRFSAVGSAGLGKIPAGSPLITVRSQPISRRSFSVIEVAAPPAATEEGAEGDEGI